MAALRGIGRYFNKSGGARLKQLVVDGGLVAGGTPVAPPVHILPTEPPTMTAAEGDLYFDDDLHGLMQYNGSGWEEVGGSATDIVNTSVTTATLAVTGTSTFGSGASMTAGAGITGGAGTVYTPRVYRFGNIIKTEIFIDLTGLNSGGADGDIIGKNTTAACHLGQWTAAINGTYFKGQMSCAELVAGGEPDIDVYSATESTGTEDAAVSGLTETALLLAAADWTQGMQKPFTGILAPDQYLYLVASGGATDATYTAGMFVLEFWGVV